ncbi:MAG: hypothetical protein M1829_003638 [Trizodia sp. TS-e1964]|nr:MAG: hypothetical protein M1829_003638 [Trizodia sp. TS-e1964]
MHSTFSLSPFPGKPRALSSIFWALAFLTPNIVSSRGTPSVADPIYSLQETYGPDNFAQLFTATTEPDKNNGFVKWVDFTEATNNNMFNVEPKTESCAGHINVGVDFKTKIVRSGSTSQGPSSSTGRGSLRLASTKAYGMNTVMVFRLLHMPEGCGTWPALWTLPVGKVWPDGGEIDIAEGVNKLGVNQVSLHTEAGCNLPKNGLAGKARSRDCNVHSLNQPVNQGCTVTDRKGESFGAMFNKNGGGFYALEMAPQHIRVWFFQVKNAPKDIESTKVNPSTWGKPTLVLPNSDSCNVAERFQPQNIMISTNFCGDWGNGDWGKSECRKKPLDAVGSSGEEYQTCEDFVAENPDLFRLAYWKFRYIKIHSSVAAPAS